VIVIQGGSPDYDLFPSCGLYVVEILDSLFGGQHDVGKAIGTDADDTAWQVTFKQFSNPDQQLQAAAPWRRIRNVLEVENRIVL